MGLVAYRAPPVGQTPMYIAVVYRKIEVSENRVRVRGSPASTIEAAYQRLLLLTIDMMSICQLQAPRNPSEVDHGVYDDAAW